VAAISQHPFGVPCVGRGNTDTTKFIVSQIVPAPANLNDQSLPTLVRVRLRWSIATSITRLSKASSLFSFMEWEVRLDQKTVKTGGAKSRDAPRNSVVWLIDKALAAKNGEAGPSR
jgi:hypothetical protein